jgi:hypothetical protein
VKKKIDPNSEAWRLLEWQNKLDMELYSHALKLYENQKHIIHGFE